MKKIILLGLTLLFLSGCNEENDKAYRERLMASIKTCEKLNGVAILNSYGRMTKCETNNIKGK